MSGGRLAAQTPATLDERVASLETRVAFLEATWGIPVTLTPTDTPAPVTATLTATVVPATETPVPTLTVIPVPTVTVVPSPTPTASSIPSATPTNTEEPTATVTVTPPVVAGQECPAWVHDQATTVGPDGRTYPTWHPAVDPQFGCQFGHEHGSDPRTSRANAALPAFGYIGQLVGDNEPHVGFKVFLLHAGERADDGRLVTADYRIVFHMGTGGVRRYVTRFHSVEYDYVARDGSGRSFHIAGMADTSTNPIGSACDNPRKGGRDFSTIGCPDPYEIWGFFLRIHHPADPFNEAMQSRLHAGGSVAVFDPQTTVDPADLTRLVFTQDYRRPGVDPKSPAADYQGCRREAYGGANYWNNAGRPTVYYTDAWGIVQPGPGPGRLRQEISATRSTSNEIFKVVQSTCGGGIHWPN